MLKLLMGSAAIATVLLLTQPSKAVVIDLGINPTSAQGDFSTSPGAGAFADQITFTLAGGPAFVTIANATNTFANPDQDEILNWTAAIWSAGLNGVVEAGAGDDQLLFGPQAGSPCAIPNCQQVGGSGTIDAPGLYYANFTGIGSGTSGYGGNISTFAVPVGPMGGLPALMALAGFFGWRRLRRA